MKSVGIITFQWYDNFGTLFQAFALQEALVGLGVDAHILPLTVKKDTGFRRFLSKTPAGILEKLNKFIVNHGFRYERGFEDFRKKYYRRGGYEAIPFFDVLTRELNEDVLIFGSDNIWSVGSLPIDYPGFKVFFGDGIHHPNKVVYGASTAGYLGEHPLCDQIVDRIRGGGFRKISLREKYTMEFLLKRGIDGVCVPDPVFLHDCSFWLQHSEMSRLTGYVLGYDIGHQGDFGVDAVAQIVGEERGLPVVYPYPQKWVRHHKDAVYPTPQQWLGLFANASFVVTNSFHGIALSLIFRKDFVYDPISGKDRVLNMRTVELLSEVGLESRMLRTLHDVQDMPAICFDRVDVWLKAARSRGRDYLQETLQ